MPNTETLKQYVIDVEVNTKKALEELDKLQEKVNKGVDSGSIKKNTQANVSQIEGMIKSLSDSVAKESTAIKASLTNSLKGFKTGELEKQFQEVNRSISGITDKINLLSNALDNSDFSKFENYIQAFISPMGELNKTISQLTTTLTSMVEPLQTISKMKIGAIDTKAFEKSMKSLIPITDEVSDDLVKKLEGLFNLLSNHKIIDKEGLIDDFSGIDKYAASQAKQAISSIYETIDEVRKKYSFSFNDLLDEAGFRIDEGALQKISKRLNDLMLEALPEGKTRSGRKSGISTSTTIKLKPTAELSDSDVNEFIDQLIAQINTKIQNKIQSKVNVKVPIIPDTKELTNAIKDAIRKYNKVAFENKDAQVDVPINVKINPETLELAKGKIQEALVNEDGLSINGTTNIGDIGGIATEATLGQIRDILSSGINVTVGSGANAVTIQAGNVAVESNTSGLKDYSYYLNHQLKNPSLQETRAWNEAGLKIETETEKFYKNVTDSIVKYFSAVAKGKDVNTIKNPLELLKENPLYTATIGEKGEYAKYGRGIETEEFKNTLSKTLESLFNAIQTEVNTTKDKFDALRNSPLTQESKDLAVKELEDQKAYALQTRQLNTYKTKHAAEIEKARAKQIELDKKEIADLEERYKLLLRQESEYKKKIENAKTKKTLNKYEELLSGNLHEQDTAKKRMEYLSSGSNSSTDTIVERIINQKYQKLIETVQNTPSMTEDIQKYLQSAAERAIANIVNNYVKESYFEDKRKYALRRKNDFNDTLNVGSNKVIGKTVEEEYLRSFYNGKRSKLDKSKDNDLFKIFTNALDSTASYDAAGKTIKSMATEQDQANAIWQIMQRIDVQAEETTKNYEKQKAILEKIRSLQQDKSKDNTQEINQLKQENSLVDQLLKKKDGKKAPTVDDALEKLDGLYKGAIGNYNKVKKQLASSTFTQITGDKSYQKQKEQYIRDTEELSRLSGMSMYGIGFTPYEKSRLDALQKSVPLLREELTVWEDINNIQDRVTVSSKVRREEENKVKDVLSEEREFLGFGLSKKGNTAYSRISESKGATDTLIETKLQKETIEELTQESKDYNLVISEMGKNIERFATYDEETNKYILDNSKIEELVTKRTKAEIAERIKALESEKKARQDYIKQQEKYYKDKGMKYEGSAYQENRIKEIDKSISFLKTGTGLDNKELVQKKEILKDLLIEIDKYEKKEGFTGKENEYLDLLEKRQKLESSIDYLSKKHTDENGKAISFEEQTRERILKLILQEFESSNSIYNSKKRELDLIKKELEIREEIKDIDIEKQAKVINKDVDKKNAPLKKKINNEQQQIVPLQNEIDEINKQFEDKIQAAQKKLDEANKNYNNIEKIIRKNNLLEKKSTPKQLEQFETAKKEVTLANQQLEAEKKLRDAATESQRKKIIDHQNTINYLDNEIVKNEKLRESQLKELDIIKQRQQEQAKDASLNATVKDEKIVQAEKKKKENEERFNTLTIEKKILDLEEQLKNASDKQKESIQGRINELKKQLVIEMNYLELQKEANELAKETPFVKEKEKKKAEKELAKTGTIMGPDGKITGNIALGDIATETTLRQILTVISGGKVPTPGVTGEKSQGGVAFSDDYKALRKQFTDTKNMDILKEMFTKFPDQAYSQYKLKENKKGELGYVSANGSKVNEEIIAFTIKKMAEWGVTAEQLQQAINGVNEASEKESSSAQKETEIKNEESKAADNASKSTSKKTEAEKEATEAEKERIKALDDEVKKINSKKGVSDRDALFKELFTSNPELFDKYAFHGNTKEGYKAYSKSGKQNYLANQAEYDAETKAIRDSWTATFEELFKSIAKPAEKYSSDFKKALNNLLNSDITDKQKQQVVRAGASNGWVLGKGQKGKEYFKDPRFNQITEEDINLTNQYLTAKNKLNSSILETARAEGEAIKAGRTKTTVLSEEEQKEKELRQTENDRLKTLQQQVDKINSYKTVAAKNKNFQKLSEENSDFFDLYALHGNAQDGYKAVSKTGKRGYLAHKEEYDTETEAIRKTWQVAVEASNAIQQAEAAEGKAAEESAEKVVQAETKKQNAKKGKAKGMSVDDMVNATVTKIQPNPDDFKATEKWAEAEALILMHGEEMAQKFIRGLKGRSKDEKAAMAEFAEVGVDAVKEALGIHSPSEVFKNLGKMCGEGFKIGILNSFDDLKNTIIEALHKDVISKEEISELTDWNGRDSSGKSMFGDLRKKENKQQLKNLNAVSSDVYDSILAGTIKETAKEQEKYNNAIDRTNQKIKVWFDNIDLLRKKLFDNIENPDLLSKVGGMISNLQTEISKLQDTPATSDQIRRIETSFKEVNYELGRAKQLSNEFAKEEANAAIEAQKKAELLQKMSDIEDYGQSSNAEKAKADAEKERLEAIEKYNLEKDIELAKSKEALEIAEKQKAEEQELYDLLQDMVRARYGQFDAPYYWTQTLDTGKMYEQDAQVEEIKKQEAEVARLAEEGQKEIDQWKFDTNELSKAYSDLVNQEIKLYNLSKQKNLSVKQLQDEENEVKRLRQQLEDLSKAYKNTYHKNTLDSALGNASKQSLGKLEAVTRGNTQKILTKYESKIEKLTPNQYASVQQVIDQLEKLDSVYNDISAGGIMKYINSVNMLQDQLTKLITGISDSGVIDRFDKIDVSLNKLSDVGFQSDKIEQFKVRINEIAQAKEKLFTNWKGNDNDFDELKRLEKELSNLTAHAKDFKETIGGKTFVDIDAGQIKNVDQLAEATLKLAKARGYSKVAIKPYDEAQDHITMTAKNQKGEFIELTTVMNKFNNSMYAGQPIMKQNISFWQTYGATLKQAFSTFGYYLGFAALIRKTMQEFRQGITTLKEFDSALTTISYTMNLSQKELKDLGNSAIDMAEDLSMSMENALKVYQIYANMQTTAEDIAKVSRPTAILSNLSGVDASTAADQVQGILQQFNMLKDGEKDLADTSMHVVDVLDKISANVAIDYSKGIGIISEAVTATGQVAHDAGMSFEELAAITAKVAERTREDGSTIGNAMKTMFVRISKVSKMPQYADEVDNEQISKAAKALHDIGIEVYNSNGQFNNITDTLTQLNNKWDTLNDVQKSNIAFQVAATRQSAKFKSMLEAWTDAMGLANEATRANGNALENQEKYEDSYIGKLQRLETEWKEFWLNLLNSDDFKKVLDIIIEIISKINEFADSTNHAGIVIAGLGLASVIATLGKMGKQWLVNAAGIKAMGDAALAATPKITGLGVALEGTSAASTMNTATNTGKAVASTITKSQASDMISEALTQAYGTASGMDVDTYLLLKYNTKLSELKDIEKGIPPVTENVRKSLDKTGDSTKKTTSAFGALASKLGTSSAALAAWIGVAAIAAATLYEAATAQSKMNERVNEACKEYDDSAESIEDYRKKAVELNSIANDNTKSLEEQQEARKDLLSLQEDMVEQFGNEAAKVDLLTESVKNLNASFDYLNEHAYQEFLNKANDNSWDTSGFLGGIFNKENWDKLFTRAAHFGTNTTNIDDILNQYEHAGFSASLGGKGISKILAKEFTDRGLNAKEGGDYFNLVGDNNLKQYYDAILDIQEEYRDKQDDVSKEIVSQLTDEAERVRKLLYDEKTGIYKDANAVLEHDEINKKYSQYVTRINQLKEDLKRAQIEDNKEEVYNISDQLVKAYNAAIENAGEDATIKQWFKDFVSDVQTQMNEHEFIAKIKPEVDTDDSRTFKKIQDLINAGGKHMYDDEILSAAQQDDNSYNYQSNEYKYGREFATVIDNIRKMAKDYDIPVSVVIDQFDIPNKTRKDLEDHIKKLGHSMSELSEQDINTLMTIDGATLMSWQQLQQAIYETNAALNEPKTRGGMIDSITGLTDGFDKLDEIYADIYDKGSFDFTKLASKKFEEAFGDLGEEYEEFIETVSANTDDLEASQEAFNKLAWAYIESTNALSGLTEENKNVAISMLQTMGIENAEEVVLNELARQQESLAGEKEFVTKYTKQLSSATVDEINQLIQEKGYSEQTSNSLKALALEKMAVNGNVLDFSADLDNIINFIEGVGEATTALQQLRSLQANRSDNNKYNDDYIEGRGIVTKQEQANIEAAAQKEYKAALDKLKNKANTQVKYTGGDKTRDAKDKANKSAEDTKKIYDWIEKAIQRQEEEINRLDKTVTATYKDWSKRNTSLLSEMNEITKEISMQQSAYQAYLRDAEAIPLSEEYKKLVREGAMRSELISDKTLQKNIDEYEELYDKAIKAKDAIEDLNAKIAALAKTKFDNVKSEFEGFTSEIEHFASLIDKQMSHVENMGKIAGKSFYNAKIDKNQEKINELNGEREALLQALRDAENQGIEEGSADWIAMRNDIYAVDESIADLTYEVEEFRKKLKEVAKLNFDDLKSQFEDALGILNNQKSLTDAVVSMVETSGHMASRAYYESLIEGSKATVTGLRKEYERLTDELTSAMNTGDIQEYSKEWYEMQSSIDGIKQQLIEAANATIEYANALRQIEWDTFDRGLDVISKLADETEFFEELLSYSDVFDKETGEWTKEGITTRGLMVEKYQVYKSQAEAYGEEAQEIKKLLEMDPKNTTLIDRYYELMEAQRQAILNTKKEQKAVEDLYKDAYDNLLERIRKLIDEYKKALQASKDLYDYENTIEEKTKTINDIRKQLMAYDNGNDTSEENRATVQKLNTQLDAAEKDLEQTEYDKYIQDQQELLDQFYTTLEEWLNGRLDQIEGLFEEAIAETDLNAQLIDDTLHETAESVSYQMTDEFTRIWDNLATSYEISDGIATVSQGILDITQGVTESIRYKMDELPTETNLESFFEGENLRLLNELSNVENNMYNMNSAIDSTTRAVDNVSSNIAELSGVIGNKIDYAGNSVVNAINSLEFSTGGSGYDAPSDGNYNTTSNSGNNYSDSSNRRSTSDYSRYRIEGYDERGIAITRDYGNDYQTAQHELEKLRKKGGAGRLIPYAKGGIVGKNKNYLDSIAQLLGEDHMIAAKEGERVLTEDQNKSFEKMVNANFSPLEGSAKDKYSMLSGVGGKDISSALANIPTPEIGNLTNVGNTTTVGDINITLPNVTNKEEFVNWLKNDGQIERIIQAFTIDRLNGGNSYGKMRF